MVSNMRHNIILFLIAMFVAAQLAHAEDTPVRTNEEAAAFFSKANVLDSTLILVAKEKFTKSDSNVQTQILQYMLDLSGTRRAVVESDSISSVWFPSNGALTFNEWNTARNQIGQYNYAQVDRLGDDKWFFTVGGELSFSSITTVGINGRVGTYLWKRFLDAGLGFNVGYSNGAGRDGWDVSANLTSRLYFTRFFSKLPLSPFVGVGFGFVFCPDAGFDPLSTAGFNWYLRKGAIDVAVQYGKSSDFGITAGYTISF